VIQELNIDGAGEFVFMAAQTDLYQVPHVAASDPDAVTVKPKIHRRLVRRLLEIRKVQECRADVVSA
jgi:hypothetical protein